MSYCPHLTLASKGLSRLGHLPTGPRSLRNGAYALQWWVFAAFAVVMAIRMARDQGRRVGSANDRTMSHGLRLVRNALIRYRIMAYTVGVLLVVLMCVGVPLKYFGDNDTVVTWTAIPHGWLYMLLLITAFDLGRRARWSWKRLILIALAGTIPFLSFVAERSATKDVRKKLAPQQARGVRGSLDDRESEDELVEQTHRGGDPPEIVGAGELDGDLALVTAGINPDPVSRWSESRAARSAMSGGDGRRCRGRAGRSSAGASPSAAISSTARTESPSATTRWARRS